MIMTAFHKLLKCGISIQFLRKHTMKLILTHYEKENYTHFLNTFKKFQPLPANNFDGAPLFAQDLRKVATKASFVKPEAVFK